MGGGNPFGRLVRFSSSVRTCERAVWLFSRSLPQVFPMIFRFVVSFLSVVMYMMLLGVSICDVGLWSVFEERKQEGGRRASSSKFE